MASKYAPYYRHKSVLRVSKDGREHESTDKDDITRLFQNYSATLADEDEHTPPGDKSMNDAENALDTAIDNLNDENAEEGIYCACCSTEERVENVSRFAAGQHISMPGKYSHLVSYRHHAIVSEVKHMSGTSVTLEQIEFNKKDSKINIYKSKITFDLKNDDICIIKYKHPLYTAGEIVQRAESMLPKNMTDKCEFGSYNPASNNCEHFATWCVLDKGQSFQVHDIRQRIFEKIRILKQKWNECIRSFFGDNLGSDLLNSINEISSTATDVTGVTERVYLLYCVIMTFVYVYDNNQRNICRRCMKRKIWDMWLGFLKLCGGPTVSFLLIKLAVPIISPTYVIPLAFLEILLNSGLQLSVSKVRKMLHSPFLVDKNMVETLSEIDVGDVISMKYWGIPHDVIVTETREHDDNKGMIKCVHYGSPTRNIVGTGEILEKWFQVDLKKEPIRKYDCRSLLTYKKEVVVNRARKRIGEKKLEKISNRSDLFSHWAKVKHFEGADSDEWNTEYEAETELKKLELTCLVEKEIHLSSELKLGDTIEFDECGILVGKTCLDDGYGRNFEIEMIFHTFGVRVQCKKFNIDLNVNKLMVKKYYKPTCLPMKERVKRAKIAEKESMPFRCTHKFLEFCILLPTNKENPFQSSNT